jgi:hypothetical protein
VNFFAKIIKFNQIFTLKECSKNLLAIARFQNGKGFSYKETNFLWKKGDGSSYVQKYINARVTILTNKI